MNHLKTTLLATCLKKVDIKLQETEEALASLQQSLGSETKSSAGDKHETGRAMLQLEMEKLGKQHQEAQKMQMLLLRIQPDKQTEVAHLGSLIETATHNYFLSVSLGGLTLENKVYYAISPQSPIGKLLLGKRTGEHFTFQGTSHQILNIL